MTRVCSSSNHYGCSIKKKLCTKAQLQAVQLVLNYDFPTNTIASVTVRGSQWQTLRETQPGAQAQTTVAFAVFHAIAS